ncbi:MAG: restriction endonuclease, partial [Candidatus Binataceae bacterium]
SAESVTLLAVGYIYGGIWAPPPTGLSPVRTKASFAAPPHTGTIRSRILIQCRHRMTKSISPSDIATLKEQIGTWEPLKVDIFIIATTGRFTSDAVAAIEKHNAGDRALKIEMWPETHLERLLAERPALIAEFGLR